MFPWADPKSFGKVLAELCKMPSLVPGSSEMRKPSCVAKNHAGSLLDARPQEGGHVREKQGVKAMLGVGAWMLGPAGSGAGDVSRLCCTRGQSQHTSVLLPKTSSAWGTPPALCGPEGGLRHLPTPGSQQIPCGICLDLAQGGAGPATEQGWRGDILQCYYFLWDEWF